MEINTTFRRSHKHETWERWRDSVPRSFRFAVKAPSAATHGGTLDPTPLATFFSEIEALQDKLGPVLFQFPPKLAFDAATAMPFFGHIANFFSGDIVCEPRHPSWFSDQAQQLLINFRIARVAVDPSPADALAGAPGGSNHLRYYRLHGSPRMYYSEYSTEFLTNLAAELHTSSVPTWCIFDNTASGAAFGNAFHLQRLLRSL